MTKQYSKAEFKVLNELKGRIVNDNNFKAELKGDECKTKFKLLEDKSKIEMCWNFKAKNQLRKDKHN